MITDISKTDCGNLYPRQAVEAVPFFFGVPQTNDTNFVEGVVLVLFRLSGACHMRKACV